MAARRTLLARWAAGFGLAALVILITAFAIVWSRRDRIARAFLAQELARRGVPARFRVVAIGPQEERIADVVLGDPRRPDLVAREATVRVKLGLDGVGVSAVEATGVRLRAEVVGGQLRLGSLDRLLPTQRTGSTLHLPAIRVTLHDARASLRTSWGPIGVAIEGSGPLDDGFAARVALVAPDLRASGCVLSNVSAVLHLVTENGAPLVDGPLGAASIRCGGTTLVAPAAQLDARASASLDRWHGGARIAAARLLAPQGQAEEVGASIGFSGNRARTLAGVDAGTGLLAFAAGRASSSSVSGRFVLTADGVNGEADVTVEGASADAVASSRMSAVADAMRETPLAPITASVTRAVVAAGRRFDAAARLAIDNTPAGHALILSRGSLRSASGATATMQPGSRLAYEGGGTRFEGEAQVSGGGLPAIDLRQDSGGTLLLEIAPLQAGGARLIFSPVHVAPRSSGFALSTSATFDGPLPGGRLVGLTTPIRLAFLHGVLSVGEGCTPVRWQQVSTGALTIGPSSFLLCPLKGGALARVSGGRADLGLTLGAMALRGRLGAEPFVVEAGGATLTGVPLASILTKVHATLGEGPSRSVLQADQIDARLAGGGAIGRFAGGITELGEVPFRTSQAAGRWRFDGGALALDEVTGRVADRATPARIRTLALGGGTLRLQAGLVRADATLDVAGGRLASVTVRHDLSTGDGEAQLAVPGITFGPRLQPEQITPLTVGVVADVAGSVAGVASVRWSRSGVASTGAFSTSHLDLAAAFGPVQGISGTIRFDDLLAMHTPPGQMVRVASINPGIEVTDGTIAYQLLGPEQLVVERGHWPLAGGTLSLRPTTLDLGTGATRRFTLDVAGLDAARFIQQMQLDNLAVTGTFDGALPLVFDAEGGRIVGGRLVARSGGGTLSYVGEVSNAQLGTFGKLAFDALKSLRYHSLALDLDGALDGEVVSRVAVDGVNQQPVGATNLGKGFTGLPFRFNVTVRAPFRGLLTSARSFSNPGLLLHADPPAPVQPAASASPPSQRPR